ncbi:MAG: hypothetical protein J3T61_00535 [Candidatus Brocadiales bacterium]|nr:hypothetical protein [Candidatus Bathyanammoxibius sp.]
MTERWLTKERRDSYKQKATRTQAGGLDRNNFTDCAIHDLEAAESENDRLVGINTKFRKSFSNKNHDFEKAGAEVERLKRLLKTAKQLTSMEGLGSEEDFFRFRDELQAALEEGEK